ncbi:hypothetical protein B0H11DRAFT_2245004 [Mycena galericulata]|nr:hypothetical protein B0H11DRAFT_2245004 [Mycena galericulata]
MTSFTPPAPGTESSIPGAALAQSDDANATAAFRFFSAALAALNLGSQATAASPAAPAVSPVIAAPAVPVAPAPAVQTPLAPAVSSAPRFLTRGPWVAGSLYHVVPTGPLMPIAEEASDDAEEPVWYCITKGRHVGVTLSNALAAAAVVSLPGGGHMKRHKTQALAVAAFNEMLGYNMVSVVF